MSWVETPRGLLFLVAAIAIVTSAVFGTLGYMIGQTPQPQPIVIQLQQPAAHP